jgi:hypothetical protein
MDKVDMINFLKRYIKICTILNLSEDVSSFNEIISFIEVNKRSVNSVKHPNKLTDENRFYAITSTEEIDFSKYNVNQEIINNKMDILHYWIKLDKNIKEKFTVLELNLIMYLLTKQNNNYIKKEKKKIIMDIDMTVRNKRTSDSYNNIVYN